jgi:SAM-dependent methyltransferase
MVYENRWDFVRPYVENKRVLDIGPAELVGTINREKFDRWIHGKIAKSASSLTGLEKNPEQVQALAEMGYNISEGDAEAFTLDKEFDVVFAGELIEHLSNPGRFLECVKNHLGNGGKVVLTTPNRFSILSFFQVIRTGHVPAYRKPIAKHVLFFDEDSVRSLLERHGFHRVWIGYCQWVGLPDKNWIVKLLINMASRYRPTLLPVLLAVGYK